MSLAVKCSRCGGYQDRTELEHWGPAFRLRGGQLYPGWDEVSIQWMVPKPEWDLCGRCYTTFLVWIKNGVPT